jgi:cell wall-associated NlpC family hydrolase
MVYVACGLFPEEEIGIFSQDWWLHTTEEKYLWQVIRHAFKLGEARCFRSIKLDPGNLLLIRAAGSKVYNHGAIITAWPLIVHAIQPAVIEIDAPRSPMWACQNMAIFDPWGSA